MTKASNHRQQATHSSLISVESFAHRHGVTKAIQEFRQRKEQKRTEKAKQLRVYQKIMKQEGYEPGKGARRKRDETKVPETNDAEQQQQQQQQQQQVHQQQQQVHQQRKPKSNPFQKSLAKASQVKEERARQQQERIERGVEREQKLIDRKKRTQRLTQRNKRGQPIMKHFVHDILQKLQKEQS